MNRYLPLVLGVLLIGAGAYYQGILSDRWDVDRSEMLLQLTSDLANIPSELGDWESEDTSLSPEEFKASGCDGYVSRIYRHRDTGEEVSVFVVSGTARHVTIHTPDWCYQGAGFTMEREPYPYAIECGPEMDSPQFSTTTFVKHTTLATKHLRIFWTYSDNGKWEGPRWPKPHFAGRPALVKVYLITSITGDESAPEDSPSIEFSKTFMPMMNTTLFSAPTTSEDSGGADGQS